VPTVPIRMQTIRNRHVVAGALISGAAAVYALAPVRPALAQDLGPLRGDVTEKVIAADTAQDVLVAPLPRPEPEDLPGRTRPVAPSGPVQGSGGTPEDDPFAAQGIRFGSFVLRPSAELGLTGSREKSGSASAVQRLLGDTSLRLELESDWDRHQLTLTTAGRLQQPFSGGGDLEPEVSVEATGRFDITDETTLTGTLGYAYELDDPQAAAYLAATDPALTPSVSGTNDPAAQTFNGALTLRQNFGAAYGETGLSAERAIYGDVELSDGSTVSQHDLDNTVYDMRLRAGVEVSPVFAPFIEASWGLRRMDVTPDAGGVDRDATRYGLRAGTEVDLGEKLSGEIAVGYLKEDIADAALTDIAGVSVDAALNWSPRRETDVALSLSTTTETSGGSGDSGALLYSTDLGVTHRARANLTLETRVGAEYRDEEGGIDAFTLSGTAALTYWFNRFTGLTTRIGHKRVMSSNADSRSDTTTAFVGLKLQR